MVNLKGLGEYTVQFTSKLTLACGEHTCVLQFLSWCESKHECYTRMGCMQVNFCALHKSIIHVMQVSKKHASNASCAARELGFLCAACTYRPYLAREGSRHMTKKHPESLIKCMDMKKIFSSIYICTNSLYMTFIFLSNQLNSKHDNGTIFRQHRHQ